MNPPIPRLTLKDPAELIASIPPLIGFVPADSAVVLYLKRGVNDFSAQVDLPEPEYTAAAAANLARLARDHQSDGVLLIVFGGGSDGLAYASLVTELKTRLSTQGINDFAAYWAAEAVAGAPWACYCDKADCTAAGTLPDPDETALAKHNTATGFVTAASREQLYDCVRAADEETLTRRIALIENEARTWQPTPAAAFDLVHAVVLDFTNGKRDLDDLVLARLSLALQDLRVRDAALSFAIGDHAAAAEDLFFLLTRECPAPHRAEAAALAAFYAYLGGRGAQASIALDAAAEACPDHLLARLLQVSLNTAVPPAELNDFAFRAGIEALALDDGPTDGVS